MRKTDTTVKNTTDIVIQDIPDSVLELDNRSKRNHVPVMARALAHLVSTKSDLRQITE